MAGLRRTHSNLRIAACTVDDPDAGRLMKALGPAGKPELWLLAAPYGGEARVGERFLPLTNLPRKVVGEMRREANGAILVFDADYLSWKETLADVEHVR